MLMDLSKDIMMDLGITVIGDIIAILKHAKQVHRQVRSEFHVRTICFWIVYIFQKYCCWQHKYRDRCLSHSLLSDMSITYNLHDLSVIYSFFRTCAKWLQKPSPQDRPVLKLSLEELPILVSVNLFFTFTSSLQPQ